MIPEDVIAIAESVLIDMGIASTPTNYDAIARAILTDREARSGSIIPAGYKLVPVEPTEEMEKAALKKVRPYHDISDQDWRYKMPKDLFRLAWTAMLAASPSPSREETEGEKDACPTCDGTGKEGRHSICRDCDESVTLSPSALLLEAEKALGLLRRWDALIEHQYSGSRDAMSDMTEVAQETAAFLAQTKKVGTNG